MKKNNEKPTIDKPFTTQDEEGSPAKKKFNWKSPRVKWIGGVFLFFLLVLLLFIPQMGTIQFGICKVLIESNEPFPHEVKLLMVDDEERFVRIYYSSIGTFGERRSNFMDCTFKVDKDGNVLPELDKVDMNGKKKFNIENPEYIKKFNLGVPAIVENPPSLVLPNSDLDNIKDYWEIEQRD